MALVRDGGADPFSGALYACRCQTGVMDRVLHPVERRLAIRLTLAGQF